MTVNIIEARRNTDVEDYQFVEVVADKQAAREQVRELNDGLGWDKYRISSLTPTSHGDHTAMSYGDHNADIAHLCQICGVRIDQRA